MGEKEQNQIKIFVGNKSTSKSKKSNLDKKNEKYNTDDYVSLEVTNDTNKSVEESSQANKFDFSEQAITTCDCSDDMYATADKVFSDNCTRVISNNVHTVYYAVSNIQTEDINIETKCMPKEAEHVYDKTGDEMLIKRTKASEICHYNHIGLYRQYTEENYNVTNTGSVKAEDAPQYSRVQNRSWTILWQTMIQMYEYQIWEHSFAQKSFTINF